MNDVSDAPKKLAIAPEAIRHALGLSGLARNPQLADRGPLGKGRSLLFAKRESGECVHSDTNPGSQKYSVDCQVGATGIEDVIRSVGELTKSLGRSDVQFNVNVFYQPVFNMGGEPPLPARLQPQKAPADVKQAESPSVVSRVSSLATVKQLPSPKALENPLSLNARISQAERPADDIAPSVNSEAKQEASKPTSIKVRESNLVPKPQSRPAPRPSPAPGCSDVGVLRRRKIEKGCGCAGRKRHTFLPLCDPNLDQEIAKVKFFWRGTNSCYPFPFKKRVLKYYVDTDEISVDDVVDFSRKIIVSEEFPF